MHAIFSKLLLAVIAAALPQLAAADKETRPEGPRPEMKQERPRPEAGQRRPDPEVMFKRLDANQDGIVKADEIPAGMPGRMKDVLGQAIKNHDGKLSLPQFREVLIQNRPGPLPEGRPGGPQGQRRGEGRLGQQGEGKALAERRPGGEEQRGPQGPRFGEGRGPRDMGAGPQQRSRRPEAGPYGGRQGRAFTPGPFPKEGGESVWRRDGGPRPYEGRWNTEGPRHRYHMAQRGWQQHGGPRYGRGPMRPQRPSARPANVDPKAIFARLDRDKDGKLSVEEFSAGVRRFQRMMAGGMQQRQTPYYSHARHYGQHGWAMHQQWSQQWQPKGRPHGHRGQLAHWQGKKSDAKPSMKMKKREKKAPDEERPAKNM